jgi:DNA-binding GntR family transcriptional regulator
MQKPNGLASQAYQHMRNAILGGELAPGAVLLENHLAEKLGMSRTPIREALQFLARDGIVESVPSRGYLVPRMSLADLRELYELRESLEGLAARCATLRVSDTDIEALERLYGQYENARDWEASIQLGAEFHSKIISLACNTRLATILDSLKAQITMTRRTQLHAVRGRRDEAVCEHRAILDAIKRRDPDAAEQSARAHVRISYDATLRGFHSEIQL